MAIDPEELLPKKKPLGEILLGQDLSPLSAHELEARIAAMEAEIVRCREAIKARLATKAAADGFFRKT
ncbi:MAG TPA: DUF1192 domain-containing protein [Rhizomicrobium sp.]|nr:DUF1192 domain-containing protein [Rhizomicrobium sp.]